MMALAKQHMHWCQRLPNAAHNHSASTMVPGQVSNSPTRETRQHIKIVHVECPMSRNLQGLTCREMYQCRRGVGSRSDLAPSQGFVGPVTKLDQCIEPSRIY